MAYLGPSIPTSGTTFTQFLQGGPTAVLENCITNIKAVTSAPVSAPTVSATGISTTTGALAAGGYFVKFTEVNGVGETTASPESAVMTVSAGNIPKVTFPALQSGNLGRNVYVTAANGATATEVLYTTGVTLLSCALATAAPTNSSAVAPPTVNTTGLTYTDANSNVRNKVIELLRLFEDGRGDRVYLDLSQLFGQWSRGEPVTFMGTTEKIRHAHTVFATLAQVCQDIGTLVDSNPGTLGTTSTGIGGRKGNRTWP
jgi:hypothetical protein